jgi:hypothetical protein
MAGAMEGSATAGGEASVAGAESVAISITSIAGFVFAVLSPAIVMLLLIPLFGKRTMKLVMKKST